MSDSRIGRSVSVDSRKTGSWRFLLLSVVVWTILLTVALAAAYGDFNLPFNLADPYVSISCFIFLWLVGILSLRTIHQRLVADLQCRHTINAQIMKAKNEWESTFDAIPNPIAIIDKNYTMRRVNRAMADKLGMDVKDCIGKKCYKYVHGTDNPPPTCPQVKMLKEGRSFSSEIHDDKLGGDFVVSVAPLYENGEISGSVHFVYDVTHSKKVENELRRNEARNRSILEAVGEGVYGLDMQGKVMFVNRLACEMLGYSTVELIGHDLHKMIHYERADGIGYPAEKCPVLQAIRNNEVVKVMEETFWRKDGRSFPVQFTATPVHENGQVSGCVVVFDDISGRKRSEAERLAFTGRHERRKRFRSLNIMAGGIAHNFNNILMAVLGNIELLLYSLPESSRKEREFASAAMEAGRRAADFSTMMLWYVGQGNIKRHTIDMGDILKEVEGQIRPEDLQKCALKVGTCAEPVMFEGDETLVRQIIINLVKNATESMDKKPCKVELRPGRRVVAEDELGGVYMDGCLEPGDYIYLEVIDHGEGMAEDALEYIFEPFYTTKFTGRGLGLPFTLGIMRSHQGGIIIKSEPGRGTTATILFPAVAGDDTALSNPEEVQDMYDTTGSRGIVLFVDDEEVLRECNVNMLQLLGFEVLTAKDGPETLDVYRQNQNRITLVLLDIGLPGMDGFEVLSRLKKIDPAVKVIIHTGFPKETLTGKVKPGEIAGYIQEPFTMEDLRQVLDEALS